MAFPGVSIWSGLTLFIQTMSLGDRLNACFQEEAPLRSTHLHPGPAVAAVKGDRSAVWVEPVRVDLGALAPGPAQETLGP